MKKLFPNIKMVHNHHEHRRYIDHAPSIALQWTLAPSHFRHFLRAQSRTLPPLHLHLLPAIHPLPPNLPRRASTSTSKFVCGNFPRGTGNSHQYDGDCMCAGMGPWDGYVRVGVVVV